MPRSIFITGFPGFIAGQLLQRFLAEPGTTVRMLVIPAMMTQAQAAREALGPLADRTEIIAGDLTQPQLGIDPQTLARLAAEVDTVYHLAAIYDLAAPLELSRRVNVQGTERVLDFCESLAGLKRLIYFSTAYVSGLRTGRVTESDLEQATAWKNYYEQTKFEAEVALRRRWANLPTIIIRPGVVVGDSRSGEINKYDGPYYVIRALAGLEQAGLVRWARYFWSAGPQIRFYMVPVDFICDATEYLAAQPHRANQAYHVLPRPAPRMGEMAALMFAGFGVKPPPFTFPLWLNRLTFAGVPALSRYLKFPPQLLAYMRHDVDYDTTQLEAALAGSGLQCPTAQDCLPPMITFAKAHPEIPTVFASGAR
ncbi:MAG TPA: SDR family oxidoreductase [Pirellulales bacterium]